MSESAPAALMDRLDTIFGGVQPVAEGAEAEIEPTGEETETGGEETTETTPVADLFDLTYGGKQYKVPVELKDAFLKNEDYTRKTQELAEQRRGVDHEKSLAESARLESAFAQSIADEQRDIGLIDTYLKQVASTDWSSMSSEQMIRQKIEMDSVKDRRAALAESINGKRSKFISDMQAKIKDLRGKSRDIASKSIEGFSEDTERTIRDYAKSEGLTEREIDGILLDPRSIHVMWKAAQFDKIKAGTTAAGDKAAKVDRVLRPGAAGERMPKETAEKLNYEKALKKASTSGQKARVIEDRLALVLAKKGHK